MTVAEYLRENRKKAINKRKSETYKKNIMKNLKIETVNENLKNNCNEIYTYDLYSHYDFVKQEKSGDIILKGDAFINFLRGRFERVKKEVGNFLLSINLKIGDKNTGCPFQIYPDGRLIISSEYKDYEYFSNREKFAADWEAYKNLPNHVKISIEEQEHERLLSISSNDFNLIRHRGHCYNKEFLFIVERKKTLEGNHLIQFTNLADNMQNFTAYFTPKMQLLEIADREEFEWAVNTWESMLKRGLPKKARYMEKGEIKAKSGKSEKEFPSYFQQVETKLRKEFRTVELKRIVKDSVIPVFAHNSERIAGGLEEIYALDEDLYPLEDNEEEGQLYGYIYAPVCENIYLKIYVKS